MLAKTRWFLVAILVSASACASQSKAPATGTTTRSQSADPVGDLNKLLQSMRDRGATDEDLRPLDQRLRLAQAAQNSGHTAQARARAEEGLALGDEVNATLDDRIRTALEKADQDIRRDIRDINQDLSDKLEDRATDRFDAVKKKIAERNSRAAATQGKFPQMTFEDELGPIEARIAAIRESAAARDVQWNDLYRGKFRTSLMRVRGNEPLAYQEAVSAHQANDVRVAKQSYLAVLSDQPNYYKALFNLGILDLEIGNFPEAATRLERAFDIGLSLDNLDGWASDFVPDPEPLIAAYHETNQTARIPDVRARYDRRKAAVAARESTRKAEQAASYKAATAPVQAPAAPEPAPAVTNDEEACKSRPYAGKVALVKQGLDEKGVEEIICAPQNKREKGDAKYWYYPSGTVIFVNGKVDRTSSEQVMPGP